MILKNLSLSELSETLGFLALSRTACLKLFAGLHARGAKTANDLRSCPQVPKRVLDYLDVAGEFPALRVVERRRAQDGFVKYLFESPAFERFEAVRIPIFDEKYIVCVSSQVGCAFRCDFCQTGRLGFRRNLKTWEILAQVEQIRAEADRPVRGVVFMGMGEPFLNYQEVLRAAGTLSHPAGFAISGKAITLSTVGVVPAIRRYVAEGHPYRLAFSLPAAIPEKRDLLLPVASAYSLEELVSAIRRYAEVRRERAMLAYVMISGFNTMEEDALALARLLNGVPVKLDLIDVTDPTGRYAPPGADELRAFRNHLQVLKAPVARRYSGGKEIAAACGTLVASQVGGQLLEVA